MAGNPLRATHALPTLLVLLLCALCCSQAATLSYGTHSNTLANPERGFYTGSTGSKLSSTFRASPKTNETLLLVSAFLDGFQTAELSDAKIADIAAGLDTIRKAGVKAIFRIAYDSDGGAPCPDPTPEMAIRHIEQLQPVMDSHKDVIAFIQAGVIGCWGEFHSGSTAEDDMPKVTHDVVQSLVDHAPDGMHVMIRSYTVLQRFTAMGGDSSKLGAFDDCLLASSTDSGTWSSSDSSTKQAYVALTNQGPGGGETCSGNSLCECSNALSHFKSLHLSYLNSGYNADCIAYFKQGNCLTEITNYMGYRFELMSATLPTSISQNAPFTLTLTIQNTGWAPLYHARPAYIRIFDSASNTVIEDLDLSAADPANGLASNWLPGNPITIDVTLTPSQSFGSLSSVNMALWLPDPSTTLRNKEAYAIKMPNTFKASGNAVYSSVLQANRLCDSACVSVGQALSAQPKSSSSSSSSTTTRRKPSSSSSTTSFKSQSYSSSGFGQSASSTASANHENTKKDSTVSTTVAVAGGSVSLIVIVVLVVCVVVLALKVRRLEKVIEQMKQMGSAVKGPGQTGGELPVSVGI